VNVIRQLHVAHFTVTVAVKLFHVVTVVLLIVIYVRISQNYAINAPANAVASSARLIFVL
jgi:hypothetical protein